LVQVTRDGGKNWANVTPSKDMMPEWIQVNSLEASPFDAGTAYVAATMYKYDDYKPYLYKTSDYGKTWKKNHERHSRWRIHASDSRRPEQARPLIRGH
jgi:photosystem II stability/assembly factor-like uncharacterized protein